MTDIRKQILLELLYVLEEQNSSKNKNFVLRELFPDDTPVDTSGSNIAEEFRYLFNIVYRKQTSVGRTQVALEKAIPLMWEAAKNLSWQNIKDLAKEDPAVLFALFFDASSLVDPSGVSDVISGALNIAYAAGQGDILGIVLSSLQIVFGFIQAGLFLVSAGASAPLVALVKSIVRGGWFLLKEAKIWSKILQLLKDTKKFIIEFFNKSKLRGLAPKVEKALEETVKDIEKINPEKLSNPKLLISETERQGIEKSLQTLEKGAELEKVATSSPLIKDIMKPIPTAALQAAGFRLGLGNAEIIAFQNKTEELKNKAEKYMRDVVCRQDQAYYEKCAYIKTIRPSLEIEFTEIPQKEYLGISVDPKKDFISKNFETEDIKDFLLFYENMRKNIFIQLAEKQPDYYYILNKLEGNQPMSK